MILLPSSRACASNSFVQLFRISLARAVYSYSANVLLDDPFALRKARAYEVQIVFLPLTLPPHSRFQCCGQDLEAFARQSTSFEPNRLGKHRGYLLLININVMATFSQLATSGPEFVEYGTHYVVRLRDRRIDFQGKVATLRPDGHVASPATAHGLEGTIEQLNALEEQNSPAITQSITKHDNHVQWKTLFHYFHSSSFVLWVMVAFMVIGKQLL